MINVSVYYFVNLEAQLFSNFSLLRSVNLTHKRQEVVTSLRLSISNIQIMESYILNNFFLLVDITFGDRDVLFSFKVVLGGISIRSSDSLNSTTSGFDVDNITYSNLLLLDVLVNTGIKFELLLSLGSLERDNN